MEKLSIFGGKGFIGGKFADRWPHISNVMERNANVPQDKDALYLISTTHNYNVHGDVHLDINTNLNKLMDVLPNVKGTFNFISSWFVYGSGYETQYEPAKEISPTNPKGFYSITKKTAEDLTVSYCRTFARDYRIMRLCNVIGGDPSAGKQKNALEFLIGKIIRNESIDLYTGHNFRNYLHVDDVCDAIELVLRKGDLNTIYNIGSTDSTRLIDIVEYARHKVGSTSPINLVVPPRFHDIIQTKNFFMNCDKLRGLGFVQKYDVYQSVDRIINAWTNQKS